MTTIPTVDWSRSDLQRLYRRLTTVAQAEYQDSLDTHGRVGDAEFFGSRLTVVMLDELQILGVLDLSSPADHETGGPR